MIEARDYAENIINTTRESLLVLDPQLKVVSANRAFHETFQVSPEETENRLIYELKNRQWDIPRLRELLEKILRHDTDFENFEVEHEFPEVGPKVMSLNARRIYDRERHQCPINTSGNPGSPRERAGSGGAKKARRATASGAKDGKHGDSCCRYRPRLQQYSQHHPGLRFMFSGVTLPRTMRLLTALTSSMTQPSEVPPSYGSF